LKNKGKINIVLDFLMLLVMLAIFCVKGEFHEALAYTLGGMLILHIVLHWQQIKALYRQLLPEVGYQRLGAVLIGILVITILTMPLYLTTTGPGEEGHHGPPGAYSDRGRNH